MGLFVALTALAMIIASCVLVIALVERGGPLSNEIIRALSVSGPFPERSALYRDFAPRAPSKPSVQSASVAAPVDAVVAEEVPEKMAA